MNSDGIKKAINKAEPKRNIFMVIWENIEEFIAYAAILCMTFITFIQVISRYVFHHSYFWTEEAARYFLIWITFAGSAYAFKTGAHIGITFLVDKIKEGKIKSIVEKSIGIITIGFFFILLYYGTIHTIAQLKGPQLSPAMRISMAIPYSAIPVGSVLIILRLFYLLYNNEK